MWPRTPKEATGPHFQPVSKTTGAAGRGGWGGPWALDLAHTRSPAGPAIARGKHIRPPCPVPRKMSLGRFHVVARFARCMPRGGGRAELTVPSLFLGVVADPTPQDMIPRGHLSPLPPGDASRDLRPRTNPSLGWVWALFGPKQARAPKIFSMKFIPGAPRGLWF